MDSLVELVDVQPQNIYFSLISNANNHSWLLTRGIFKLVDRMKSKFSQGKQNNFWEFLCHQLCSEFTILIMSARKFFSFFNLDGTHHFLLKETLNYFYVLILNIQLGNMSLKVLLSSFYRFFKEFILRGANWSQLLHAKNAKSISLINH